MDPALRTAMRMTRFEQGTIEPTDAQVRTITTALGIDQVSYEAEPYDAKDARNEINELRETIGLLRKRIEKFEERISSPMVLWMFVLVFLMIVVVRLWMWDR